MTEIKRYDAVLVDGVPAHRPSDSGRWVMHEDHAAIVAEKDVRIAELESAKRSVTENYLRVTAERNEALYKVIELQEQVRALAAENATLSNLQPTELMVSSAHAEAEHYDNLNLDEDLIVLMWQAMHSVIKTPATDARIRAGEQP